MVIYVQAGSLVFFLSYFMFHFHSRPLHLYFCMWPYDVCRAVHVLCIQHTRKPRNVISPHAKYQNNHLTNYQHFFPNKFGIMRWIGRESVSTATHSIKNSHLFVLFCCALFSISLSLSFSFLIFYE